MKEHKVSMGPQAYYPVEYIFNCLSVLRWRGQNNLRDVHREIIRRGLWSLQGKNEISRLSFWLRLSRAGSLLDEDNRPTLLVEEWLGWSYQRQMMHLLEAWQRVPRTEKSRRLRRRLLELLMVETTSEIPPLDSGSFSAAYRSLIPGLQVLGICEGDALSKLGVALLGGRDYGSTDLYKKEPVPWRLVDDHLIVNYPPDWRLLWKLEGYFDPSAPGLYPLDSHALRLAAQRYALEQSPDLLKILELGLEQEPSNQLVKKLIAEPVIRILPGPVLEFSDSEELKALRKSRALRQYLEHLLSPRHVVLNHWHAQRVLRLLLRRGLISELDISKLTPEPVPAPPATPNRSTSCILLSRSERAYLLSLMLMAEGIQNVAAAPLGLLVKLTKNMDHCLLAAAARKATAMMGQIRAENAVWETVLQDTEDEAYERPGEALVVAIQEAIDRAVAIDVLYKASGRHMLEARHLTPLLLEKRGSRYYLNAYCHLRRANRTFRLDRMKFVDFPSG